MPTRTRYCHYLNLQPAMVVVRVIVIVFFSCGFERQAWAVASQRFSAFHQQQLYCNLDLCNFTKTD
jgi:hypothetical protein